MEAEAGEEAEEEGKSEERMEKAPLNQSVPVNLEWTKKQLDMFMSFKYFPFWLARSLARSLSSTY